MEKKLTLNDVNVQGKKVLMRVDFNVPMDQQQKIRDDTRIKASLPSIQYVLDQGGALVLMSHLGRPKGPQMEFSLAPCAKRLAELLGKPVLMASDCIGSLVEEQVKNLKPGQIILLENLRFHEAEEKPEKNPNFAKQLSQLGDVYVNDAFGTAHRAHSSTVEVAKYFPGNAVAGFLLQKEIQFLQKALNPVKPFYALIGGAKISSKIGILKALIKKVDALFIAGGMSYTFFKAEGIAIGDSIHEDEYLETAKDIIEECRSQGTKLFLPLDIVAAVDLHGDAGGQIFEMDKKGIPKGFQGADIGPKTIQLFCEELRNAKTVFWNGPVGVFENKAFNKGTYAISKALAEIPATTIVGGGDSIAAIHALGLGDKMTHLSTGGGASLEFLEFGTLPGIEVLSNKK